MNMKINLGDNLINKIEEKTKKNVIFADDIYRYELIYLKNKKVNYSKLKFYICFLKQKDNFSSVYINGIQINIGDYVEINNTDIDINCIGGEATLLIAGVNNYQVNSKKILKHVKNKNIYKVNKPWGHELWLSENSDLFAFKEIFIKKGFKTSLQYHEFKIETNVLFNGKSILHYNDKGKILDKNDLNELNIKSSLLNQICIINISPYVIHRLEAKSDLLLYEVSTPHLNDVIRLQDDSNRKDGRIDEEHK